MNTYIGLDLGTSALKAAAFSPQGSPLASSSIPLPTATAPDGRREQSPTRLLAALAQALHQLLRQLPKHARLAGISLAAQGGSFLLARRSTGQALTPLHLWNDFRFLPFLQKLPRRPPSFWRKIYLREGPGWGLARLLWLQSAYPNIPLLPSSPPDPRFGAPTPQNAHEKCKKVRRSAPICIENDVIYAGAGEFLFFHLTGHWRQDPCNALQIGCYNVPQNRLDNAPLTLVGTTTSLFAPLRPNHSALPLSPLAARHFGLPTELEGGVAGPYMDHEAGYLAVTSLNPSNHNILQLSLGTAWVGNYTLPTPPVSPFQLVIPAPADPSQYLMIQPLLTGNVTWDWALTNLLNPNPHKALQQLAPLFQSALLPPDGLTCLPWFNMPNPLPAPLPTPLGAGAFFGLSPHTTRADLFRSLAAAMTYETRRVFAALLESCLIDSVLLTGGAAQSPALQTLLAAALNPLPVRILQQQALAGPYGAILPLLPTLPPAPSKPIPRPPKHLQQSYDRAYALYQILFSRLYAQTPAAAPITLPRHPQK